MRIAFFTENYFPMVSGVSTSIKLFKEGLEKEGHRVFIFAPSYDRKKEPREEDVIRLPALPIRIHQTPIVFPGSSWKQFIVPRLGVDIIHVHHPFFLGRTALFWARLLKVPIVYTFHTLYEAYVHYAPLKREIATAFVERYVRKFVNQVDLIISPSFSIKEYLLKNKKVRKPIVVIPTGIKWEEFQIKRNNRDRREKLLLFVGRLGEEKNVPLLLKVLFRARDRRWRAVFVGDGPDRRKFMREVREEGMGGRIAFPGMLPSAKLRELYARSYLFLFSSFTETQGLVILEAMASGVPILAMKAPGVSDFVHSGYTGFLAESEEDFYRKLLLLLENEELHALMSLTSREWAKLWDISLMASKLAHTYERLIEGFKPPSSLKALSAFVFL